VNYEVRLSREAVKTLDRMDSKTEKRIRSRLHELSDNPLDPRLSKSLTDMEGLRSSRVGGFILAVFLAFMAEFWYRNKQKITG